MQRAPHLWNTAFTWRDHDGPFATVTADQARSFDDLGYFVFEDAFDATTLQRLTDEVASLRDDMQVLTAIVQRLDNSHTRLLTEIRATHAQVSRLGNRVRRLETAEENEK